MQDKFVHLHLHSHFSILDGIIQFPDLIKKLKSNNSYAVALTDHGNLFGAIDFYRTCIKEGIKPIIGCEVYVCPDMTQKSRHPYHLVLLARNNEGYRNLVKLVSCSHIDGFYYKPRVDYECLEKYSEGIGLKNVKRRLELLYPDHYQFDLIEEGKEFKIELKIDLEKIIT